MLVSDSVTLPGFLCAFSEMAKLHPRAFTFLCVVCVALVAGEGVGDGPRIAVIGGGIGGAASAYWLHKLGVVGGRTLSVDLYEREDKVGGRAQHTIIDGFVLETGGAVIAEANVHLLNLTREMGLNAVKPPHVHGRKMA